MNGAQYRASPEDAHAPQYWYVLSAILVETPSKGSFSMASSANDSLNTKSAECGAQ